MYLEEAEKLARNLDSVRCKIRDGITDEPFFISLSDLSEHEKRNTLTNCSDEQLKQIIEEMGNSFVTVISLYVEEVKKSEERRLLLPVAYGLADTLRYFGDYHDVALSDDYYDESEGEATDDNESM